MVVFQSNQPITWNGVLNFEGGRRELMVLIVLVLMRFGRRFGRPIHLVKYRYLSGDHYMGLSHVFVHWQIGMLVRLSIAMFARWIRKIYIICYFDALEHSKFGEAWV
jgi:hypothetical protein